MKLLTELAGADEKGFVGALIRPVPASFKSIEANVLKKVDVVFLDTLHASPHLHTDAVKALKDLNPNLQVVSGNVVYEEDAAKLAELGVDAIRVGFTGASINDGYAMTGCGRSQAAAVTECAYAAKKMGVPVIADGGIANIRQMVIAFALGANSVMMGSMFASMVESNAPFSDNHRNTKLYRGMSRPGLIDEDLIPEGLAKTIAVSGSFLEVTSQWQKWICLALARAGVRSIDELHSHGALERKLRGQLQ